MMDPRSLQPLAICQSGERAGPAVVEAGSGGGGRSGSLSRETQGWALEDETADRSISLSIIQGMFITYAPFQKHSLETEAPEQTEGSPKLEPVSNEALLKCNTPVLRKHLHCKS
jgi:hypothetical protein